MLAVGPTFFSSPVRSDHPIADGLTIFQTTFAGGSTVDEGYAQLGAGIQENGTVSPGVFTCIFDTPGVNKQMSWYGNALQRPANSSRTYEMYFDLIQNTPNPVGAGFIGRFGGEDNYFKIQQNGYSSGATWSLGLDVGTVTQNSIWSQTSPGWGLGHHFAVVFRTTGIVDAYVDGIRVITQTYTAPIGLPARLQLGGFNQTTANREMRFYGARVRAAEMYNGAFFVVPGVSAWGPP